MPYIATSERIGIAKGIFIFFIIFFLSGCGQTGTLYLPDQSKTSSLPVITDESVSSDEPAVTDEQVD